MAVAAVLFATGVTFLLLGALHFWYVGRSGGEGEGERVCRGGTVLLTRETLWRTRAPFAWMTGCSCRLSWRAARVLVLVFPCSLFHLCRERDRETGVVFLVIGGLCFLPGSYASYNLWHAWRGTPGFHFHHSALRELASGRRVHDLVAIVFFSRPRRGFAGTDHRRAFVSRFHPC